ncbi:MAG: RNA polymerase subunit sigma-70 [Epulopiscium sp. Nuni2H_MBin003]|nr:MAG: RNA polymerase subunit sigma-70 [Epulopiscium sp. Nuni2H_MBin003]
MRITENNFIEQLQKRNEDALYYVIEQYGWVIQSVVKKQLYNLENYHDDCINEILMKIWQYIDYFNADKGSFKTWVAGISKFNAIDYQRKYIKDLQQSSIDDVNIDYAMTHIVSDNLSRSVDSLLEHLSAEDKQLFLKIYAEECKVKDVSSETGIKEEVIYNRLSRGKRKLRQLFGSKKTF